jgi:hypothetical protein
MKACENRIAIDTNTQDQGPSQVFTPAWEGFLSNSKISGNIESTITSPPGLSPSVTTPGVHGSSPATPRLSFESDNFTSRPQKRIKLETHNAGAAGEHYSSSNVTVSQLSGPETPTKKKRESIIDFIQYRLSISASSVASALTVQGTRAYRWSTRFSLRSQDTATPKGCDLCVDFPPCGSHENVALYLLCNGPIVSESCLLAEVTRMIHSGADVNNRTPIGETALHIATGAGFQKICQFLLDHGADVYAETNYGETIGKHAKRCCRSTGTNASRYASIKWCLVEVKKHRISTKNPKSQPKPPPQVPLQNSTPPQNTSRGPEATEGGFGRIGGPNHRRNAFKPSIPRNISGFNNPSFDEFQIEAPSSIQDVFDPSVTLPYDPENSIDIFTADLNNNDSYQPSFGNGPSDNLMSWETPPSMVHEERQPNSHQPFMFSGTSQAQRHVFSGLPQAQPWAAHIQPAGYGSPSASVASFLSTPQAQHFGQPHNRNELLGTARVAVSHIGVIPSQTQALHNRRSNQDLVRYQDGLSPQTERAMPLIERIAYTEDPWVDSGCGRR